MSESREFGSKIHGICDASAAIVDPDGNLLVATDEHNKLISFKASGQRIRDVSPSLGQLLQDSGLELESDGDGVTRELDIEGVAELQWGDKRVAFWIGSHSNRKAKWDEDDEKVRSPKERPNRRVLFATNLPASGSALEFVGSVCTGLADALLSPPPELASRLAEVATAEPLWPNAGGWNIEGLTADPEGRLIVGFRSPVDSRKRALVVRLENPKEIVEEAGFELGAAEWLDLETRGIRSVDWSPSHQRFLIVAGPVDNVDTSDPELPNSPGYETSFAIYEWGGFGQPPAELEVDLSNLRPEILVSFEGGFYLISDDGKVERPAGGLTCADHLDGEPGSDPEQVYARARFFPLSP